MSLRLFIVTHAVHFNWCIYQIYYLTNSSLPNLSLFILLIRTLQGMLFRIWKIFSGLCTKRLNICWLLFPPCHYMLWLSILLVLNGLNQFKVTEADIEEFEANYRGSDSEKKDLIDLYKKCKGNMNKWGTRFAFLSFFRRARLILIPPPPFPLDRLFCSMLCSDPKLDSHRFKDMLDEAIAAGEAFFQLLVRQAGLEVFCSRSKMKVLHLFLTWFSI